MLSSVVAVFGGPERSSFPKLVWSRLNSAAQNFMMVNDFAEFPYTVSNSSLVCVGVLPFINKYLMSALWQRTRKVKYVKFKLYTGHTERVATLAPAER